MKHRNGWAVALLATTALVSGGAVAQTQTAQRAVLEEIVVTAEKRESSIQDVSASISAISGDVLTRGGIQDTQQLINVTPNLIVQRSVIGKLHIRGIGNENYSIAGDPSVAVHTDGVYVARATAGLFDLFDISRVEVLRGPQGTLYGRNATAGVINVIPNTPGDEFSGYATAQYGNYDKIRLEAAAGGPLGGGFQGRIAVLGAWRDGYTTNVHPTAAARGLDKLDDQDLFAIRGQLAFDNGGPFTARLMIENMDDNSIPPPYEYLRPLPPYPFPVTPAQLDPPTNRTVNQGLETALPNTGRSFGTDEDLFLSKNLSGALHLNYAGDAITVTSITGYRRTRFNWLNEGDGTGFFHVTYGQQDRTKQWSQEIRIASADSEARFSWLAGGYFFRETGTQFWGLPLNAFGITIFTDGTSKTTAYAGFGEVYYRVTDRLKLTLGGRYSHEKRAVDYTYRIAPGVLNVRTVDDAKFNNFSPKAVLTFDLNDDSNVYVSATRGFKSGGFNFIAIQPGFSPEKVWSFEGGYKSTFLEGRARFNASIFYSDFKDLQVGQIVNASSVIANAAGAELYGVEADFAFLPTENFEIGGSLGYLHAEFTDFCSPDAALPAGTRPEAGCTAANPRNLTGFKLPRAPSWSLSTYAEYRFVLPGESTIAVRGDVRYQSKMFFTQWNRPRISQNGYALANARITWTSANEAFSVGLWANNLFNKDYFSEVLEPGVFDPNFGQVNFGPPRTYGVTATVRF